MKLLSGILVMVGCLLAAQTAAADETALDLLDAPVAYTAHFTVSSAGGTYHGTVWHSPGRERRDWDTAGGGQAVLLDRIGDAAYLIKPSGRWYVGFGLHAAASLAGGLDGLVVDRRRLGEETVAGMRTTRYRVTATASAGGRFDGDAWFSHNGILVKAAGMLQGPDGKATQVETSLSDVVVGPTDPAMLALPSGYFGMDLRKVKAADLVQAVNSLKPLLEGRSAHQ